MSNANSHPAFRSGHVAVVTGAASGIGLASARSFSDLGLKVCLVDRDEEGLKSAAAQLPQTQVMTHVTDVADFNQVKALEEAVTQAWGPVHVVMNNAAIGGGGDLLGDHDAWMRLLGVNLNGVINGVQAFLPDMMKSDQPGVFINTGSKQGVTQPPGNTAYNVAKAGVKALTEGLAHTLRETCGDRITAHLLIPGFTYTGMMARHFKEKPPAAWTPEQVAERLMTGLDRNEFYILCPDNETTREQDEKRMAWHMGDIIENRPALSRWHKDFKDAFEAFMKT